MSKFEYEYKHLIHNFQFTSQASELYATPASVERVQKCVLTLAGTRHFAILHGTGGGGGYDPLAFGS